TRPEPRGRGSGRIRLHPVDRSLCLPLRGRRPLEQGLQIARSVVLYSAKGAVALAATKGESMRMKVGLLAATFLAAATVCVTALAGSQATPPGVTSHHFVIGGTFPLSGPASYYAPIPVGMKVYFTYINTRRGADHKRGIGGRQIIWKYYDDSYSPPITVQQTRKLVEEDKVFALFGGLGTEPQQAVVDYLNTRKVPQ